MPLQSSKGSVSLQLSSLTRDYESVQLRKHHSQELTKFKKCHIRQKKDKNKRTFSVQVVLKIMRYEPDMQRIIAG